MDRILLQVDVDSFEDNFWAMFKIGAQREATFASLQIALIGTKPNYFLIFLFKVMFDLLSGGGAQRGSYLTNFLSTNSY